MSDAGLERIELMGMLLHTLTEQQCNQAVMDALGAGRGGVIVTANLDHLRRFETDARYRSIAENAELVVADGAPLIWASHVQGTPLPERVAGANLIWSLSAAAAKDKRSIFFLGGNPGTAEHAADVLADRYPGLRIAGTYCPPLGFEESLQALDELRADLKRAAPDLVLVALGSPKQEYLIDQVKSVLPKTWWVGVGISFSFVSGDVERAPKWMQQTGLEWVYRLTQEPQRLAKRYLVHGIPFGLRLMSHAALKRLRSTST